MKWNRVVFGGVAIALAVASLAAMQWQGSERLADTHEVLTARRINRLADKLLGAAHQAKDDLLLQQTTQAIALIPGISWAAVVDSQGKIIAHNDLSQLGKTFHGRAHSGLWIHGLEDGKQEWGKFIFGFSDASFQQTEIRQTVQQILLLVMAGLVVLGLGIAVEKKRQASEAKLADSAALLEQEKVRASSLEVKAQQSISQSQLWMQAALGRFPEGALFLDSQQRIVALNSEALSCLNLPKEHVVLGKSWHEIPVLASCGTALDGSLASPGRLVESSVSGSPFTLTFETIPGGLGTWGLFFASKDLVK